MNENLLENLKEIDLNTSSNLNEESATHLLKAICNLLNEKGAVTIKSDPAVDILYSSYIFWNEIRVRVIIPLKAIDTENINTLSSEVSDLSLECLTLLFFNNKENYSELLPILPDNILFLFPLDLIAVLTNKCTLLQLVDFKIYRINYQQKNALETEYDESLISAFVIPPESKGKFMSLDEIIAIKRLPISDWVDHPLCDRIYSGSEKKEIQVLIGPSASGKTTLSFQVGWKAKSNSKDVKYLNLGQIEEPHSFQFSNVAKEFQNVSNSLFIIDDTQANPNIAKLLCYIHRILYRAARKFDAQFMFLSWPEFSLELLAQIPEPKAIHISAEQVRNNIILKYNLEEKDEVIESVIDTFGSDLFLLNESLKYLSETKKLPSSDDLALHFWKMWKSKGLDKIEQEAKRTMLIVCSLGRFDIPINPVFLCSVSHVDIKIIDQLVQLQVLRRVLDMVTLGHRSFATLLGDWLSQQNVWESTEALNGPKDIYDLLHAYLRSLPPSKAIDSLRVIHNRSGFKGNIKLSRRSAALIDIWQVFDSVLERIFQQQSIDPTWANDPSSTMFAIEALSSVGRANEAKKSIDFLRSIWSIDAGGNVLLNINNLPTVEDFNKIGERMSEEDESFHNTHSQGDPLSAKKIDLDQMHKNWLIGVLLTAEAAYNRSSNEIKSLIKYALSITLPGGGYYPERVPWVSARILIGLSSAGITSANSSEVRKTLDWLLKEKSKGGALSNGIWKSGTGTWNSDLEVSSMCTLALIKCGIDPSDPRLESVRRLIKSTKQTWTNPSTILDGALAAEAYLSIGGRWDEIADEVRQLTLWTKAESFWKSISKHSKETFTQSCRVAQISSHLINVGWTAVRSDLPSIVNAIDVPWVMPQKSPSTDVLAKRREPNFQESVDKIVEDATYKYLGELTKVDLNELSVVGNYRRFNEKTRIELKGWCSRITKPLKEKSIVHENFLIWASPGSGKTFLIQEIANSLGDDITYAELNLATLNRENFNNRINPIFSGELEKPLLCLVDEIDSRSDESWPYEDLFSFLDKNLNSKDKVVFVLIGSTRAGIEGLASNITSRPKGKDLIDRIPISKRFIIPSLDDMDKMTLILSHLSQAATLRNSNVDHVEKLALYYIITNDQIKSPRQIRDLCYAAVQRIPLDETYLKYSDLFDRNDNRHIQLWFDHRDIAESLSNSFIKINL